MKIYVVGVNYKTTPVEIREKFSMGPDEYEKMLSGIKKSGGDFGMRYSFNLQPD
ncbi:hypothetical protein [Ruminiclostridium cellobioparum]|uniref:hypothetical protein n=1 Tax=Ruminiclostridium cellobioparum TaxID=29355 RepID=UPI00034935A1|nr:hypothetical protein [Ruminiclostridium cellobioparum]